MTVEIGHVPIQSPRYICPLGHINDALLMVSIHHDDGIKDSTIHCMRCWKLFENSEAHCLLIRNAIPNVVEYNPDQKETP